MGPPSGKPDPVRIDFGDPAEVWDWSPLDDVVMGGRSSSSITPATGYAVFSGVLRPQDGAGFASVRSAPLHLDLSRFAGVQVRMRGDGRRYELRLRNDLDPRAPSYGAHLPVDEGQWTAATVPFGDLAPTFRGRALQEAPPLDRAAVRSVALLLADGRSGPFRLEIAWIAGFTAPE